MTVQGIDISSPLGDYASVARECGFVYIKATDGVGSPSPHLLAIANALRAVGMGRVIGAYHFVRVRHAMKQDADEQCRQFMDARANASCPLPPWFDVELGEEGNHNNRVATHDEVRAARDLFLETWQASCSDPLPLYSSPGEIRAMGVDLIPGVESQPLALAAYVMAPGYAPAVPVTSPSKLPAPWTSWMFCQWAGDILRYGGVVDLVAFNGTLDDLLALSASP